MQLHIVLDEIAAKRLESIRMDMTAACRASGETPWTASELAANLLRELLEEDAECEMHPLDMQ